MERDRSGVAFHLPPRNFETSVRKFWLNGLCPMVPDQIHPQYPFSQLPNYSNFTVHFAPSLALHFHLSKDLRQSFLSVKRRPPFHIQLHLLQLQRVKSVHRKALSEEIHKGYNIENRQMASRITQNGQMIKHT